MSSEISPIWKDCLVRSSCEVEALILVFDTILCYLLAIYVDFIEHSAIFRMTGTLAMPHVLSHLSFSSASMMPDHHICTFEHFIYEMARELGANTVCECAETGCFFSVEDFAAVINDFA